jgi:hypothetical protein
MKIHYYISIVLVLLGLGCKQSSPEDVLGRVGDEVTFAGRKWDVKWGNEPMGPGPNMFSRFYKDVWVDENGWLHLNIAQNDGVWYSTEVVGRDNLGYGKYTWTIQADPMSFSENVVFGLFTWDNNTFYTDGNSEVDIEFAKWGDTASTTPTTFSVQPVSFGAYYAERTRERAIDPNKLKGVTTHTFTWTDTLITWASYAGETATGTPLATWDFDLNHPPRRKMEGGQSSLPIVIPKPGCTTNARMNLWTLPYTTIGPNNQLRHEVVIRNFIYEPISIRDVRISSVVAAPTSAESVTLMNHSNTSVNLSGWVIGDADNSSAYTIPQGVVLNSGESLSLPASTLGIQIDDANETINLGDGLRCIDSWTN